MFSSFLIEDLRYRFFELNDMEFRAILKLLIIKNYGTGSAKDIDDLIASTLGEDVIFTDRQNMSISYIFPEDQRNGL